MDTLGVTQAASTSAHAEIRAMRSLPLHRGTASACPAIHTTWKRRDLCRTSHRVPTRPRALSASFAFTPPDRNGKLLGEVRVAEGPSFLPARVPEPADNPPKPLKINQDLAMYRARQLRISGYRAASPTRRAKLLAEAEGALRACMAMDPTDGRAYVALGKVLVSGKRFAEAEALYESGCTATCGANAHIWTAWAHLARLQGDLGKARRLFDAAIVASPAHAAAWHGWGQLERTEGNVKRARDLWIKGKSSQALWHTWAALESRRQPVDANRVRALYRRGLQAAPGSRYLLLSWAMWEKAAGDVEAARKLLEQGTQACPRDAALWSAWAKLEEQQGEVGVARELYKQGSVADPSHLYVWQGWGCLEFRQGNNDSARALFQRGISMCPPRAKSAAHLFQPWAVLESRNGNTRLARELFKCAVKADPESSPSWNAWADMEANLGALERANELRNFSMQERREVVKPFNFTTLPKAGTFSSMVRPYKFDLLNDMEAIPSVDPQSLPLQHPFANRVHTADDGFGPSAVLATPATFGTVYLGHTFRACVVLCNLDRTPVSSLSVTTEGGRALLHSNAAGSHLTLPAGEQHSILINHGIKEVGLHTLTCSAAFTDADGNRRQESQAFRFSAANPLIVRTKQRTVDDDILLEVVLESAVQHPFLLTRHAFLANAPYVAQEVSAPAGDGNSEPPLGPLSRSLAKHPLLCPNGGSYGLVFRLSVEPGAPRPGTAPRDPGSGNVPLGKLDLEWTGPMGEERAFLLGLEVHNAGRRPSGPLLVSWRGSATTGAVVASGQHSVPAPALAPGERHRVALRFLPLAAGQQLLAGCLLTDERTGAVLDTLQPREVFIHPGA
ncbi:PsbB mRNA maturation factor Mbb1, chloroplastic [Auxenochlorella protothecoides]|uniref:PsbB mRNA maturation factor Mbb1, chloroplastic n=1 Tax=Auxenochlorella protothecoides TaxID=3075 RepID=A0A087SI45_AUXPR|nr:PsbB mRNA maturation factor Mbb1, chloroplastic [Auxenochlorella protothecoides]KFM25399.1 PsbB mRNA maturation factor Mbb1, chloroplastic [Auxenochlorella protothecoides]